MIGTLIKQSLGLYFLCVLSNLETKPLLLKMQQMFIIAINVKIEKEVDKKKFFPLILFSVTKPKYLSNYLQFLFAIRQDQQPNVSLAYVVYNKTEI